MSEIERSDADVLVCKVCAQTFPSEEMISTRLLEGHEEDGSPGRMGTPLPRHPQGSRPP
jgi:hypothetical protein